MNQKRYTQLEIEALQQQLLEWFRTNQRDLPWRSEYSPYHVWISEIMGQQTQMDRVVDYFSRWISRFPDISAVAEAPEQHILKAWEGLGYYFRARNIHRTAKIIVSNHEGQVPDEWKQLLALPGIGPYTAAAILSIAFNQNCPLLDANVERLFARLLDRAIPVKQAEVQKEFRRLSSQLLPHGKARLFNQALMEFGALVCRPKSPDCPSCPVVSHCLSLEHGTVARRPVVVKKVQTIEIVMACGIICHEGLYYIQQRTADDVWGSLWEFPGGRLQEGESPEQAARREIMEETEFTADCFQPFATVVHHYTKYRVTLHGFTCALRGRETTPVLHTTAQYRWVSQSSLTDFPFPAGHRRLVKRLCREVIS